MKSHFSLPENGSNYAWSFDGVPEENSILLDFGGCIVETPALNLVYTHPRELLGDRVHARFGKEFLYGLICWIQCTGKICLCRCTH